jgi:hypothetical protein
MVMSSSSIEDLNKLMDKLITHMFFLIALELNIVDIIFFKDAIHVGRPINLTMINPSQMQIII